MIPCDISYFRLEATAIWKHVKGPKLSTLAARLRLALDLRLWSPADLDRETGAGTGLISKWLNGKQEPSAEWLGKLSIALRVSGHWLLTDQLPVEPPGEPPDIRRAYQMGWQAARLTILAAVEGVPASAATPTEPAKDGVGSVLDGAAAEQALGALGEPEAPGEPEEEPPRVG
jgi:transcriptional regulator with XRE-family HTH domain